MPSLQVARSRSPVTSRSRPGHADLNDVYRAITWTGRFNKGKLVKGKTIAFTVRSPLPISVRVDAHNLQGDLGTKNGDQLAIGEATSTCAVVL